MSTQNPSATPWLIPRPQIPLRKLGAACAQSESPPYIIADILGYNHRNRTMTPDPELIKFRQSQDADLAESNSFSTPADKMNMEYSNAKDRLIARSATHLQGLKDVEQRLAADITPMCIEDQTPQLPGPEHSISLK